MLAKVRFMYLAQYGSVYNSYWEREGRFLVIPNSYSHAQKHTHPDFCGICVKWSILTVKSKIRSGSAGRWELPLGKKIHMTRTSFPKGLPIDYGALPIVLVTIITPRVSGVGV